MTYCYPCRHFSIGTGRAETTFTKSGFCDWKHALGKAGAIIVHNKSITHKQATISWKEFTKNTTKHTSIADRLDSLRQQEIKNNRHYVKCICEILLLCARQELALRGHDESIESKDRGNFLEILNVVAAHDDVVKEKLRNFVMPHIHLLIFRIASWE